MNRRSGDSGASSPNRKTAPITLDPYFAFAILVGAGVGTWALPMCVRLTILWSLLLLLWLAFREGRPLDVSYEFSSLGRGLGIGLALGVPLVLVARRALMVAVPILYLGATTSSAVLAEAQIWVAGEADVVGTLAFVNLVLLAPLAESLFFLDVLHRERGYLISVGLYAVAGLVFFFPVAGAFWAVLLTVCGVTAVLGAIYGFLFERYGLATALAARVAINLCLLFIPALLNLLSGS